MLALYVDDIRNPKDTTRQWTIARSYTEAVNWLEEFGVPKYMSFDHDLGDDGTGYDLANWMVEKDIDMHGRFIPNDFEFNVHSANPVGAENIESKLNNYMEFRKR